MTIFQSSYSQRPSEAVIGQQAAAFEPSNVDSRVARGLVKAGYGVFLVQGGGTRGTQMLDPGEAFHIPNPDAAADVDAIKTTFASSASIQSFTTANLNGVVGASEMQPPRKVTFICDASTDWDPTNVTLTGYNHLGQLVSETLAIATSTTATSTNYFRKVTAVSIPAQTGAGGTATMGIAALSALTINDFLGVAMRQPAKTTLATAGLYGYPGITSTSTTADYVDGEPLPVLTRGGIWVFTEEAVVDRDKVFVRIAAGSGGSVLGAFRNDADTATCVEVVGARFMRDASAGLAWVKFPYV